MNTNEKKQTVDKVAENLRNEILKAFKEIRNEPDDDFSDAVPVEVLDKIIQAEKLITDAQELLFSVDDFAEKMSNSSSYTQILVCNLISELHEIRTRIGVGNFLKNDREEAIKSIDEQSKELGISVKNMAIKILTNLSIEMKILNIVNNS